MSFKIPPVTLYTFLLFFLLFFPLSSHRRHPHSLSSTRRPGPRPRRPGELAPGGLGPWPHRPGNSPRPPRPGELALAGLGPWPRRPAPWRSSSSPPCQRRPNLLRVAVRNRPAESWRARGPASPVLGPRGAPAAARRGSRHRPSGSSRGCSRWELAQLPAEGAGERQTGHDGVEDELVRSILTDGGVTDLSGIFPSLRPARLQPNTKKKKKPSHSVPSTHPIIKEYTRFIMEREKPFLREETKSSRAPMGQETSEPALGETVSS
uniref:Uncharacterized protein n=1 Tax=Setaria viridis TaxID=4556 RepID=A0A4U6UEQ4_SETVI|nr:hypothetical protein SEVIR_5G089800v2 [Setaria viridis]